MKAILRLLLLILLCLGTPAMAGITKQNGMTIADAITDLRALNIIANPADQNVVYVRATNTLFGYSPTSVAADDGSTVIQSNWNSGPGRWLTTSSGGGGSTNITCVTANVVCTPSPITGTGTIGATYLVNAQTGTTYTIQTTDAGRLVTTSNASSVAVTVPSGTTLGNGFSFDIQNKGAGVATLTPTAGTINGSGSLALAQNQGCTVTSDGTNLQISACTALGAVGVTTLTAGSNITFSSGATCTTSCTVNASSSASTNLGTAVSSASPQITGDATTGFYTAGAGLVDVGVSGVNVGEWSSTAYTTPGTVSAGRVVVTSSTASGNGMSSPGSGQLCLSTSGSCKLTINAGVFTGIPTFSTPLLSSTSRGFSITNTASSGTNPTLRPDNTATTTGWGASSAGVIDGIIAGVDTLRLGPDGIRFLGTAPTPTGTGSPVMTSGSTDTWGEVTGGTLASSIIITFATAKTNAPMCVLSQQTQAASFSYTVSTTAITITQTATTGSVIDYDCHQR